jgi:hypothetical protein
MFHFTQASIARTALVAAAVALLASPVALASRPMQTADAQSASRAGDRSDGAQLASQAGDRKDGASAQYASRAGGNGQSVA